MEPRTVTKSNDDTLHVRARTGGFSGRPGAGRPFTLRQRTIVPSEWCAVDTDGAAGIYITGMAALNLPLGPLGDWHDFMWRPPAGSDNSTRTPANERLCRVGMALWKREALVDARKALATIGHPAAQRAHPVWAASHPRAVAEMVMDSLYAQGEIYATDVRESRRWLDQQGRTACAHMLERAGPTLNAAHRALLDRWVEDITTLRGLDDEGAR